MPDAGSACSWCEDEEAEDSIFNILRSVDDFLRFPPDGVLSSAFWLSDQQQRDAPEGGGRIHGPHEGCGRMAGVAGNALFTFEGGWVGQTM